MHACMHAQPTTPPHRHTRTMEPTASHQTTATTVAASATTPPPDAQHPEPYEREWLHEGTALAMDESVCCCQDLVAQPTTLRRAPLTNARAFCCRP